MVKRHDWLKGSEILRRNTSFSILFMLMTLLIFSGSALIPCEKNAPENGAGRGRRVPDETMNNLSDQQIEELYSMPVAPIPRYTFPQSLVGVSSYNSDCKPSITDNGRQLYFISQDNNGPAYGGEQYGDGFNIYVARCTGTEWDSVTNLGPDINPASYACISADGQTLYLTRYPHIYVSTYVDTAWTTPIALPPPVNVVGSVDKAPFITPNGHQLYFASDRSSGYGGDDLYVVRWSGTAWDSLTNLGPPVNTDAAEAHPAVVDGPNGLELYFSDFGGPRATWKFGGMDIYISGWTGSGWGPPAIVNAPINSDHPLCSIFPTGDGGVLFASGRVWGDRIFYSLDAGSTWADIDFPYDNSDVSVAYLPYLGKTSNGDLWAG